MNALLRQEQGLRHKKLGSKATKPVHKMIPQFVFDLFPVGVGSSKGQVTSPPFQMKDSPLDRLPNLRRMHLAKSPKKAVIA